MASKPHAPLEKCTAKSKRTHVRCCRYPSPGKTVCYYHGGAKGCGRPISSYKTILQRYSPHLSEIERPLYEKFCADAGLDELGNEIALARMKLARYMEAQENKLDQRTLDNVLGFADSIARIVEKRHKIQYGEQVTIRTKDFDVLADRLLEIAERIYGNDERYGQFLTECAGLKLAASARASGGS